MSVLIDPAGNLSAPLPTPDGVETVITREGISVTETYTVKATTPLSSYPPIGTLHASYGVPLQQVSVKKDGQHAVATFQYGPDQLATTSGGSPTRIQQLQIAVEMAPLRIIDNAFLTAQEISDKAADSEGKKTKAMYFATYTNSRLFATFSFSESNIEAGLSKTGTPPGVTGATTRKWRNMGRNVVKEGAVVRIEEVWEFRPWLA